MRTTLVALAAVLSMGNALAQDKPVNLRFSYWIPPKHQLVPSTHTSYCEYDGRTVWTIGGRKSRKRPRYALRFSVPSAWMM